jgi:hypothetical protein
VANLGYPAEELLAFQFGENIVAFCRDDRDIPARTYI